MQKYGQHFLINENVINQIIDAALLLKSENLVEIGPGKGALTARLIDRGCRNFTVVEIDPEMEIYLRKNLPESAGVKILRQNFLQADLETLAPRPTLFVSNLPYIDAADILDKVLSCPHFQSAVFMFQKEQAQRIRAARARRDTAPCLFSASCVRRLVLFARRAAAVLIRRRRWKVWCLRLCA